MYTPWQNLKKVDRHDVGTVTFHKMSKCKYVKNVSKDREMLRRINKTKEEPTIDLAKAKARRDEEERLRPGASPDGGQRRHQAHRLLRPSLPQLR